VSTDNGAAVQNLPLFERILGRSWQELAPQIRELHTVSDTSCFAGRCTVRRGSNLLALLIGRIMGFPKAGPEQPIRVQLSVRGNGERWVRTCGGRTFSSTQRPAELDSEAFIRESFGPVAVDMALLVDHSQLFYGVRGWSLFGVRLPLALGPRSTAVESVQNGAFKFDVVVGLPLAGLIVHYVGVLTPETKRPPNPAESAAPVCNPIGPPE
jgi:hypothetical protein